MIWVRECVKRHLSGKSEDVITNEGNKGRHTINSGRSH